MKKQSALVTRYLTDNDHKAWRALFQRALSVIRYSSPEDFDSQLAWGQWCRALASDALRGDKEAVAAAEKQQEQTRQRHLAKAHEYSKQ